MGKVGELLSADVEGEGEKEREEDGEGEGREEGGTEGKGKEGWKGVEEEGGKEGGRALWRDGRGGMWCGMREGREKWCVAVRNREEMKMKEGGERMIR